MRMVFGLVLLIGIGLAGTAVYFAKSYMDEQQAQLAEAERAKEAIVPVVDVFVVNKQMRYGQRLTKEDVKLVRWPEASIPEGAFFLDPEDPVDTLFPEGVDELRSVLRTMEPDEAVMAVKVTEPGEDAGVGSKLSQGMRAFAIQTDVTSGVSGFIKPGDRVDVYFTGVINGEGVTRLIQSGIRIVAINQSADEDANEAVVARTVTVEVDPTQVAKLAQAQANGRLSLSLVGADDDIIVSEAVQVDLEDVLGIEEEVVVEAEKEEVCTVRRRNGEQIIDVVIPCRD